eukprot:11221900-Lingulodinium_polyedra.AAC.1
MLLGWVVWRGRPRRACRSSSVLAARYARPSRWRPPARACHSLTTGPRAAATAASDGWSRTNRSRTRAVGWASSYAYAD